MLTFIFTIGFDIIFALAVMTGIWIYFNRENESVLKMKDVVIDISSDFSNLQKDLKVLKGLTTEIAQPLLNPRVIDVASNPLPSSGEDQIGNT